MDVRSAGASAGPGRDFGPSIPTAARLTDPEAQNATASVSDLVAIVQQLTSQVNTLTSKVTTLESKLAKSRSNQQALTRFTINVAKSFRDVSCRTYRSDSVRRTASLWTGEYVTRSLKSLVKDLTGVSTVCDSEFSMNFTFGEKL